MEYNIKNITDLTEISSGQIQSTDYFLLGRTSNSYYSTFKTMFDQLSSLVLTNVQKAVYEKYDNISCLNGKTDEELHKHLIDAYVAKQIVDDMNSKTYPIGSIFMTTRKDNPKDILNWSKSEWRKISAGRCIMGSQKEDGSDISTIVESGLPKITAETKIDKTSFSFSGSTDSGGSHSHSYVAQASTTGVCGGSNYGFIGTSSSETGTGGSHDHKFSGTVKFDAQIQTEINTGVLTTQTVQPPSFIVNIWERIN